MPDSTAASRSVARTTRVRLRIRQDHVAVAVLVSIRGSPTHGQLPLANCLERRIVLAVALPNSCNGIRIEIGKQQRYSGGLRGHSPCPAALGLPEHVHSSRDRIAPATLLSPGRSIPGRIPFQSFHQNIQTRLDTIRGMPQIVHFHDLASPTAAATAAPQNRCNHDMIIRAVRCLPHCTSQTTRTDFLQIPWYF